MTPECDRTHSRLANIVSESNSQFHRIDVEKHTFYHGVHTRIIFSVGTLRCVIINSRNTEIKLTKIRWDFITNVEYILLNKLVGHIT